MDSNETQDKAESKNKSFFDNLNPTQLFLFGIVAGVLVLCTIGFFILLGIFLKTGSLSWLVGEKDDDLIVDVVDDDVVVDNELNGGTVGSAPKMIDIAASVGLDLKKFSSCVQEKKFAEKVEADVKEVQAAGVSGTPYSVVIGPKGETIPIKGAFPYDTVEGVVKQLLGQPVSAVLVASLPKAENITVRPVDPAKESVKGNKNASVTIIEYSDFECIFCSRFHETMNKLVSAYNNDVRWVYRHFPIDELHRKARTEALASECAREQGKFWEFTDSVFSVTPSNDGLDITL